MALLASTVLGASVVAEDLASDHLRQAVREHIRTHARDPELTPAALASQHHISLRSLQRLFEGEDGGVAAVIREQRLMLVRRDLGDPLLSHCSIGAVALRAGIRDQAWLSRSFRSRFGTSPSDYRRRALRPGE